MKKFDTEYVRLQFGICIIVGNKYKYHESNGKNFGFRYSTVHSNAGFTQIFISKTILLPKLN